MEVTNKGTMRVVQSSGDTDLYGSKIRHSYWITLQINTADGGESMNPFDRLNPEFKGSLITVDLSLLQFAEMLTSIGKGEGTPCTIRRYDGKGLPKYELPDQKKTLLDYAKSLDDRDNESIRGVRDQLKAKLAEGKRPTRSEMMDMINELERADQDRSNIDFIATTTQEVFEAAVREARQQIDTHMLETSAKLENKPELRLVERAPALCCEHANEMPAVCPCPNDCYCKDNSCRETVDGEA